MDSFSFKAILKKNPSLRLLAGLTLGFLIGYYFPSTFIVSVVVAVSASILFIILSSLKSYAYHQTTILKGIVIWCIVICSGIIFIHINNVTYTNNWYGKFLSTTNKTPSFVLVELSEDPIEKTKTFKCDAKVNWVWYNSSWKATTGNIILYFQKNNVPISLKAGQKFFLSSTITEIKNARNPGGFDYKTYCLMRQITHQTFIKPNQFALVDATPAKNLTYFISLCKNYTLNTLKKYIADKDACSISQALLIGYREELDKDLVEDYSKTGVVHIIAISGMHLGMIFAALQLIYKRFKNNKLNRLIQLIFTITILWLFSLVAGAAPSILRSTIMFSCIALANFWGKKNSFIYNCLCISASILLCYNPYWLWDVGFQLSYTAVLSILFFQPIIEKLFYTSNHLLKFIWKLVAVTVAAQVLTFPIIVYHFHQFPKLFVLSNLVAVPLSGIILYAEVMLIMLSGFSSICFYLGKIIEYGILTMNIYIQYFAKFTWATWDGLYINIGQAILLLCCVLFVYRSILTKNKWPLKLSAIAFALFLFIRIIDIYNKKNQQQFIVYNVPKHAAAEVIMGNKSKFIGDTSILTNEFLFNFHIKPTHIKYRVEQEFFEKEKIGVYNNLIYHQGNSILLLKDKTTNWPKNAKTPINTVVLSNNCGVNIDTLFTICKPKLVVFDASNSYYFLNQWKAACNKLHLPYYSVPDSGAFILQL